jgi:O-antigen/teichoic acid export membrane protein
MKSPRYVTGVIWSVVNAGAGVVLPLVTFTIFAHVVPPILIGFVAIAIACTEILKTAGLQGLYEALLQQPADDRRCHETACFVSLVAGAALVFLYLAVLATLGWIIPDIGQHYGVLAFVGLRILSDLATMQPQAMLALRLSYRMLALRGVIANTIAGAAGIAVVMFGDGMTGLVVYQVGQSIIIFLASVLGTNVLARPRFDPASFRRMAPEATLATCVRFIAATVNNLDQIMISALVGGVSVAYFNLGKRIESTFITMINSLVGILFQPMFALRRHDAGDEVLRRSAAVSTIVCGIPAVIFFVGSGPIVRVVFGPQWENAAAVAAVLALSGFARAVGFVPGALMSVSGRNREVLITATASAIAGAGIVAMTARFGIVWCAAALAVKNVVIVGWMVWWLEGQVRDPIKIYLWTLIAPFALMLCGVEVGHWLVGPSPDGESSVMQLSRLAVSLVPGAVVTVGWFSLIFRDEVRGYCAAMRHR